MTYSITKATEKDGVAMLRLLEQTELNTPVEIMLTRRPNSFLSYKKECENAEVFLIKNDEEIVLEIACLTHELQMGGSFLKAAYICGLRKKEGIIKCDYKKLAQAIFNECKHDFYYANILDNNPRALNFLTKGHEGLPHLHPVCKYSSFVFRAGKIKPSSKFGFRNATETDYNRIEKFLYKQRENHDFFPAFDFKQFADLDIHDFYVLEQGGDILCVCALWRQESYKQYVIKRYNGILRVLSVLPVFPKAGCVLANPVLTFFVAKNEEQDYYREMLRQIGPEISKKSKFYTIGAVVNSALYTILLKRNKAARFDSTIYLIDFKRENNAVISKGIHVEGGML